MAEYSPLTFGVRTVIPQTPERVVDLMTEQLAGSHFISPRSVAEALFTGAMSWAPEHRMNASSAASGAYTDMTLDRINRIRMALDVLENAIVKES